MRHDSPPKERRGWSHETRLGSFSLLATCSYLQTQSSKSSYVRWFHKVSMGLMRSCPWCSQSTFMLRLSKGITRDSPSIESLKTCASPPLFLSGWMPLQRDSRNGLLAEAFGSQEQICHKPRLRSLHPKLRELKLHISAPQPFRTQLDFNSALTAVEKWAQKKTGFKMNKLLQPQPQNLDIQRRREGGPLWS